VPDDALLDAAAQSQLSAGPALHAQVERMLADPRAQRALRDYVDDWLNADTLLRTSRDTTLFPQFTGALAADMREEIQLLFQRVAWEEDADLFEVFTSEQTMVTPALAALYGLPPPAAPGFSAQNLAQVPTRQGLLTQAGILTATSVGSQGSSIVDRGVFMARTILCRQIPDPPANVVTDLPPPAQGLSERDTLAQHRTAATCATCHDQLDTLGVGFEMYNAIGALQTVDQAGNKLTGAGTLTIGGKPIAYSNVREYVAAVSSAPELSGCLVHKMLQYALARPLVPADGPALTDLTTRFDQGGHHYRAFLASLAEAASMRIGGVPQ
jgi:hypothetical protein